MHYKHILVKSLLVLRFLSLIKYCISLGCSVTRPPAVPQCTLGFLLFIFCFFASFFCCFYFNIPIWTVIINKILQCRDYGGPRPYRSPCRRRHQELKSNLRYLHIEIVSNYLKKKKKKIDNNLAKKKKNSTRWINTPAPSFTNSQLRWT